MTPPPSRLAAEQGDVIVSFLEEMALGADSGNRDFAMQVQEEW